MRNRSDQFKKDLIQQFVAECHPDFESGLLKAKVDKVFNFSEIRQAHEYIERNENIGKVVLVNDLE